MKNITVSVDDLLDQMAREFLATLVAEESGFKRLQREQNDLIARIRAGHPGFAAADRLTRDEAHDRYVLRGQQRAALRDQMKDPESSHVP